MILHQKNTILLKTKITEFYSVYSTQLTENDIVYVILSSFMAHIQCEIDQLQTIATQQSKKKRFMLMDYVEFSYQI